MQQLIGLDIGSRGIKVVELGSNREGRPELLSFGMVPISPGLTESSADTDQDALVKAIKNLLKEVSPSGSRVAAAFPESKIFTRVIELPRLSGQELKNAVEWESERFIPLPRDKVQVSSMILPDPSEKEDQKKSAKGKMRILLVAVPLDIVNRYLNILEKADLEPVVFETETIAMIRSLAPGKDDSAVSLIISLGARATDLCIIDRGVIQFTRSIGTGGDDLTKVIARDLGFDYQQAEEYKRAYGLMSDKLGGKIVRVMKPVFDIIVNEIEKAIISYQTEVPMRPIKRVVLTGGTAKLPGIVVYLAESLGVEVQIGDPWVNISVPSRFQEEVLRLENQTQYTVATGLALKNLIK